MRVIGDKLIPNDALVVKIRGDHKVTVCHIPHDLSSAEANKIAHIVVAQANSSRESGNA
jgi:hypothetical protein